MFLWYIILLFACSNARDDKVFTDLKSHDYCYLTRNITIELNYYQIVLLIDNDKYQIKAQTEYLKKCILQDHPTMIIDFQSLYVVNMRLQYPSFGSPRSTTIYIMLYHENSFFNYKKLFDTYTEIWHRSIRPKWLSIYLANENDPMSNDERFRRTLFYSWKHKFLDFTIVEMKDFNQTMIYTYNPFRNHFQTEIFNDNTIIFPDKMHDMFGYELKTIFLHEPPTLFLQQDEFGNILSINSTDYWNIKAIAKVMNFTLTLLPTFDNDFINENKRISFAEMSKLIYNGSIDFSGNQLYLWGNDVLQRSYMLRPDGQCALIPIRPEEKVKLPKSFYVIVTFTTMYVVLVAIVAKTMKFNKQIWTWLTLTRVLLGVTIPNPPREMKERIIIGCIILLSFFCVTDFYAKITDVQLTTIGMVFKSFDELDKSSLIPLVYPQYFNRTFAAFEDEYQAMYNLKRKSQFWNNPISCADLLIQRNNTHCCIISERLGRDMTEKFRSKDNKARLSIMRPCFWITWKGYAFTPASPYVEKFDKILGRIAESGLAANWEWKVRPHRAPNEDDDDCSDDELNFQMIFILSAGYLISGGIFLVEITYHRWRLKLKNEFSLMIFRWKK